MGGLANGNDYPLACRGQGRGQRAEGREQGQGGRGQGQMEEGGYRYLVLPHNSRFKNF